MRDVDIGACGHKAILPIQSQTKLQLRIVRCYMILRGVAVLELDSHPDRNKGPDHAGPYTNPIDH